MAIRLLSRSSFIAVDDSPVSPPNGPLINTLNERRELNERNNDTVLYFLFLPIMRICLAGLYLIKCVRSIN